MRPDQVIGYHRYWQRLLPVGSRYTDLPAHLSSVLHSLPGAVQEAADCLHHSTFQHYQQTARLNFCQSRMQPIGGPGDAAATLLLRAVLTAVLRHVHRPLAASNVGDQQRL